MSALEDELALQFKAVGLKPERQFKWMEDRRFRADFAFPKSALLIECQGGQWVNGRHNRGSAYDKECAKWNLAQLHGWKVIQVTPAMIRSGEALRTIEEAIKQERYYS